MANWCRPQRGDIVAAAIHSSLPASQTRHRVREKKREPSPTPMRIPASRRDAKWCEGCTLGAPGTKSLPPSPFPRCEQAPGPRSTTRRKMLGGERGNGERVEGTGTGAGVGKTGRNDPRPSSAAVIVARNQTSRRRRDRRRANPSSWAVCDCFFLVTAASAGRLNPRRHRLA